jgi:hypothetical protein
VEASQPFECIFIAYYSQKESDRLRLGLRFMALAPRMMPDTELGKLGASATNGYVAVHRASGSRSASSVTNVAYFFAS